MDGFSGQMPFLLLMLVVFFFFIILPQQRRQKKEKNFMRDLSKGDRVITKSGLHAKVLDLNDNDNMSAMEQQVQDDVETASRSLKAMSHPLRLMILCKLGEDEFSVQDIVDNVGTSQSNISQHLAILRDKGILSARKSANKVFYKVSDLKTLKLIEMMREVFCSHPK